MKVQTNLITQPHHSVLRTACIAGALLAVISLGGCLGDGDDATAELAPLTPVAGGGVVCKDYNFKDVTIPPKQISITNNSDRTIYPVLTTSPHPVDQWLQACARDTTNNYPVTHVEKLYINQGMGIPRGSSVTITLPLFSTRTPTSNDPDTYITWWNGGRAVLADENDNLLVTGPGGIDTPSTVPPDVTCSAQGTSCALSEYTSNVQFLPDVYAQLSEYTFGNVNPPAGQSEPLLVPENVGYNISYVDHVYMPVAIGPKGNPYIGYNGSAMPLEQFKTSLQTFLNSSLGTGWPVYNVFDKGAGDVRLPGGYNIFAERAGVLDPSANVPVKPINTAGIVVPPVLTVQDCIKGNADCTTNQQKLDLHFGAAVQRIQNLWGSCVTGWDWGPGNDESTYVTQPLTPAECATANIGTELAQIRDFFQANFNNYNALWAAGSCSNPDPNNPVRITEFTFMQAITHIYGWVPFNEGCGAAANKLADTVGPDGTTHAQIQPIYIHQLQYNYAEPYAQADPNLVFNPYVQLIHDKQSGLGMNAYAFSVDDGVGFMTELGSGLNFTVGGTTGLDNQGQFSYQNGFTLKVGVPQAVENNFGQPLITKYGVCVVNADPSDPNCTQDKEDVTMPTVQIAGFRVGTVSSYPIVVRFTDAAGNRYIVPVTQQFEPCDTGPTGVCHPSNKNQLVDQANCKVLTPLGALHQKSAQWCGGFDPNETAPADQPQLTQNYLSGTVPVDYLP